MKLRTFTFLKHKTNLFSFAALMLGSILFTRPAFSQADYYYGINKKGFRLGVGAGATMLQSNWSSSPVGVAGIVSLDYDITQYFSVGIEGVFGTMKGQDDAGKLYFYQSNVNFTNGDLNFRVAVGQFTDFATRSAWGDVVKRIYIGAGIGAVYSQAVLKNHNDGKGLTSIQNGAVLPNTKPQSSGGLKGTGTFTSVPVNFGTNIALRGFLGSDKVELNPNLQYTFVMSPLFDGYQPSSVDVPASHISKNGNQAYFIGSLSLRYKF